MAFVQRWRVARVLRRCTAVGRNVVVDGPLVVQNLGQIRIGDGVVLRSSPATSHLVTGPGGSLDIGRAVQFGHGFSVAAHELIRIGDAAVLGPFAMLLDTDFHEAGKHDSAGGTGAIHIGAGARLGARVTVLRGSRIGDGAVVAPGSVVKGDVAPGAHVAGNPARVVSNARHGNDVRAVDIDAVREIVAYTFGMPELPSPDATRDDIEAWDSLGMLNLLLSLEEAFDVSIGNEAMLRVTRVEDLVAVLEAAGA